MYAIIKTGGKQYRVEQDDIIDVELLKVENGSVVEFDQVLFVNDGSNAHIGQPTVAGFIVKGEVIGESAGRKKVGLKYKPRQHTQKKWGHRQHYTRVKILEIGGAKPKAKPKKAEEKAEEKPKKAAPKKAAAPKKPAAKKPAAKKPAAKKTTKKKEEGDK